MFQVTNSALPPDRQYQYQSVTGPLSRGRDVHLFIALEWWIDRRAMLEMRGKYIKAVKDVLAGTLARPSRRGGGGGTMGRARRSRGGRVCQRWGWGVEVAAHGVPILYQDAGARVMTRMARMMMMTTMKHGQLPDCPVSGLPGLAD